MNQPQKEALIETLLDILFDLLAVLFICTILFVGFWLGSLILEVIG